MIGPNLGLRMRSWAVRRRRVRFFGSSNNAEGPEFEPGFIRREPVGLWRCLRQKGALGSRRVGLPPGCVPWGVWVGSDGGE